MGNVTFNRLVHISGGYTHDYVSKKILRINVGFVGSQPTLLLFDACLNILCKSNNVGCDPTNPTYPFLFGEFFY